MTQAKNLYYESGGWNIGVNEDDSYEEALSYDKNGNILTLNRSGELISGQPVEIDDLTYTYTANQLQSVTDATNNPAGFNDGNTIGADYTYDAFGNLKTDKNKGITGIKYNHLNLPTEITFANGKIDYTYDATGTKVKKVVQPNSGVAQTTDYLYGFQYLNGVLQFFPHAEGYVKPNGTNSYLYVYQYKDHLGNIRLSYADCDGNGTINPATEILEENNYYPFGLQHQGYNDIANSNRSEEAEAYKYNGKEYEDALGLNMYEYGARNYDPAVGRFFNIDNYAEKFSDMTPYQYAGNTPTYFIDKNGEYIYVYDEGQTYKFDAGKLYAKGEDGNWAEHTPKAGSFLEQVYMELKSMYEFSTGGGGTGDGGNSFSSWFIGLFNNDNINVNIKNNDIARNSEKFKGNKQLSGSILIDIYLAKLVEMYTANKKFEKADLQIVLFHELAHALSFNLIDKSQINYKWIDVPGRSKPISIDEVFATIVENQFRSERNLPLRTHYLGKRTDPTTFEKSRIYNQNKETGQFEMTIPALNIFNNYKKSIQNKGIQWKD